MFLTSTIDYSSKLESILRKLTEVNADTALLEDILAFANLAADASVQILGILVFFVVVLLCYFAYKFFRIFF